MKISEWIRRLAHHHRLSARPRFRHPFDSTLMTDIDAALEQQILEIVRGSENRTYPTKQWPQAVSPVQ
jgi:hypothetical protein